MPENHLGQVVRSFRMHNDIKELAFALTVGRSVAWLNKFEKTGRCYERTRQTIFDKYPLILDEVLKVG